MSNKVQLRLPPQAMAIFICHQVDTVDEDSSPSKVRLAEALKSATAYGSFNVDLEDLEYVRDSAANSLDIILDSGAGFHAERGMRELIKIADRLIAARRPGSKS